MGGLALFASIALAACGGGGSSPGGGTSTPTAPPVVSKSYSFPVGDASAASGDTAWDITGVTTTLSGQFGDAGGDSYDTLRVDVTFAQNITNALPADGAQLTSGSQLGVAIAFDTDANATTGNISTCNTSSELKPYEYVTDQGNDPSRLADGNYSILMNGSPISSGGSNPPSEAMTSVSGNTLSEIFFLSALGVNAGKAAPRIGISVAASNGSFMNASGPGPTDCVPLPPSYEFFTT